MPGSLHSESAKEFYRQIGAPQRALSILENGFKLPFLDDNVPEFWYRNNKSLIKHFNFAEEKVNEWLEAGYIEETFSRPKHISPLSVATRTLVSDEIKFRLCLDATFINDLLVSESTKLPTLELSESLIEKDDFFSTLDLQNCYFHVKLHESDHDKVAFALPLTSEANESRYRYFVIKILVYGLKPATLVIHLLTKPLIDHLSRLKVKSTIYIDDIRCNSDSDISTSQDTLTIKEVFTRAGWIFNDSKETQRTRRRFASRQTKRLSSHRGQNHRVRVSDHLYSQVMLLSLLHMGSKDSHQRGQMAQTGPIPKKDDRRLQKSDLVR